MFAAEARRGLAYAYKRGARFFVVFTDRYGRRQHLACPALTLEEAKRAAERLGRKEGRVRAALEFSQAEGSASLPLFFGVCAREFVRAKR